jgi:hypothetical protein
MNPFQRVCVDRVEPVLARHGIETVFERLPGDPDPTGGTPDRSGHYRASVPSGDRIIEIYLYLADAGLKTESNWYVLERHRYPAEEDLADALGRKLQELLAP